MAALSELEGALDDEDSRIGSSGCLVMAIISSDASLLTLATTGCALVAGTSSTACAGMCEDDSTCSAMGACVVITSSTMVSDEDGTGDALLLEITSLTTGTSSAMESATGAIVVNASGSISGSCALGADVAGISGTSVVDDGA